MNKSVPYFSEEDIAGVLDYACLVPLMAETLVEFSTGQAIQPVRQ